MIIENNRLLVVDDDTRLRDLLKKYLTDNGALVTAANTASRARLFMDRQIFDLIIMDVMLPGEDGFSLVQSLHNSDGINARTPILFLTAMAELDSRLKGLDIGGDDYLTKPFEPQELLLRIRNIIRRSRRQHKTNHPTEGPIVFDNFTFYPDKNQLYHGRKVVPLTDAEKHLLTLFLQHPGEVLTRSQILQSCKDLQNLRSVDVQVTRLRRKIVDGADQAKHLQTIRNQGYIFYL